MPDTEAQKNQIKEVLKQRYFPMMAELNPKWTPVENERNRLSRSLAAFAIEKLADVDPVEAANSVVDAGDDNGIDAVHFDRAKKRLWLVQSKIGAAPDMGENKKFCDGIRDLQARRFQKFNKNFARLQTDVEDALDTIGLIIQGCNAHLSEQLGPHAIADLDQLKKDLNQFVECFDWQDANLSVVHGWLTAEHAVSDLNVRITLENWYGIDQPRRAFYGLVGAEQLAALYQQHGKALFQKNIRHYLGAQEVNLAIATTVRERPAELFYLNNGLTAVCSEVSLPPSSDNQRAAFTLKGFSVVNGAQTVGSIAAALSPDGVIPPEAKIFITLIEVDNSTSGLGPQITTARNKQNAVQSLHFAALDPNQERLRQELAVSNITYHYRPSEEATQGGPNQITIEQATLALASFRGETKLVVAAKKEIGQIYDRSGDYYQSLFLDGLSGVHLGRMVRIFEYLNGIFEASEAAETNDNRRMFYRQGRYFILHILARRHRNLLDKSEIELSNADKVELSRVALELAELIYTVAEALFHDSKGYLAIFRNITDATHLAQEVMKRLAQSATAIASLATTPTTSPGMVS